MMKSARVTVDGVEAIDFDPSGQVVDTDGVWETGYITIARDVGYYTLCFEFEAGTDDSVMLLDAVSNMTSPTATEPASFSTVKSLY